MHCTDINALIDFADIRNFEATDMRHAGGQRDTSV